MLIIDMISTWDFPDADKLLPRAVAIAPRVAQLKSFARERGWPVVYANDNLGRWRSDQHQLLEAALQGPPRGARIARLLTPDWRDYFVLKPKHSAFFATPLELLLQFLRVRRLVIAGLTSDQCVLATAADARMHEYQVIVPRDAVTAQTAARTRASLRHFSNVMEIDTTASHQLA